MPSLAITPPLVRDLAHRLPLAALVAALVVATLLAAPPRAGAQTTLSHTEDAAPIPAGTIRFRAINGWTRIDERFGVTGRTSLGADFSTDSLGPRQFPGLAPIEAALKTLTADPQRRLTLGRLETRSDARIVTTPLAFEYGVTRRLSVGVLVPVVQTRRAVQLFVNADSTGNVTFVPALTRRAASTQNAALSTALFRAADSLTVLLARCPSTPTATGCVAINANPADAAATRALAQQFAASVRSAFGADSATTLIAPRSGSTLATAIETQRAALAARLRTYVGATLATSSGVFTSAGNFSYVDLNGRNGAEGLLQSRLGGGLDSLYTTERVGFGDISVGAQYLVFDRFATAVDPAPVGLQSRLAIGGAVRFATSRADSARNLLDIGTGEGAGVEVHSAVDLLVGRLGGTIAARYSRFAARTVSAPLRGDPEAFFPSPASGLVSRTGGAVLGLDLTPRYYIGDWLSLNALYGVERVGGITYDRSGATAACNGCADPAVVTGASHTAQRAGFGLRYSTVDPYLRGRARYPIEVSLSHLETLTDGIGQPALRRDVIQLRLFYRLRR